MGLPVVYFDLTPVKSCSQLPNKKREEETTVILSRHGSASALVRSADERLTPALDSFPAHIRDFKNLKGIWHQMLARSHQLQSIFRLLKPFLHVQIWCQSVAVFQNHGVLGLYLLAFEVPDRRLKLLHSFISSQKRTRVVPGALTWVFVV